MKAACDFWRSDVFRIIRAVTDAGILSGEAPLCVGAFWCLGMWTFAWGKIRRPPSLDKIARSLYTLAQDEYPPPERGPQPHLEPIHLLLLVALPSGLTVGRLRWVRDGETAAGRREAEEFDSSAFLLPGGASALFPSTGCPVVI